MDAITLGTRADTPLLGAAVGFVDLDGAWRSRILASTLDDRSIHQFESEAGRRIGYPDYRRLDHADPLGRWVDNLPRYEKAAETLRSLQHALRS